MSPYVLGSKEGQNLIYDCFAVSNHYGNSGGGHYTAYAQNYLNNNWYDFDDNYCTQIAQNEV